MAVQYQHHRELALPLVADDDPNVTPPAAGDIFQLKSRPPFGNTLTLSHSLYGTFESPDVTTGTFSFTTWERDHTTGQWVKVGSSTALHRQKINGTGVQEADLFVQVTATGTSGLATKLVIHLTEQGSEASPGYGGTSLGTVTADQGAPGLLPWPVTSVPERATAGLPVGIVVSTTAVLLAAANSSRKSIAIVNVGTSKVYLGGDNAVTDSGATLGALLTSGGGSYTDAGEDVYTGAIWAIGSAVAVAENVSVWERT